MKPNTTTTCDRCAAPVDLVLDAVLEMRAVVLAECRRCGEPVAALKHPPSDR